MSRIDSRMNTDVESFAGGDRMSNLGAGLGNIDWNSQQLSKFEKKYVSVARYFFSQ